MSLLNQIIIEGVITRIEPADGSGLFRFELSHRRESRNADGQTVIIVSTFEMMISERFYTYCERWLRLGQLVRLVGHLKQDENQPGKTVVVCEHIDFLKRSI